MTEIYRFLVDEGYQQAGWSLSGNVREHEKSLKWTGKSHAAGNLRKKNESQGKVRESIP